ncbi:pyridoxamine 5'-phosphate oxidase family protein [Allosalinactinospora lopnorensis]|uniref:pyridoxamine 5'-phosphate oxidase family protein n=1 Tax=Allosalinactinospora lopnorensis TaxID=1352348 RepID=UPI0006975B9F|nr:pyridoxamine 5'-phosphate oxidase family protein [Allosalinactinospora lopnorensis]
MDKEPVAEPMEYSMAWDSSEVFPIEGMPPKTWERALSELRRAQTYWLATVRPDGRPHAVPVLAVVVDGVVHFCANEQSRKARNLELDSHCVITASGETLDLVVEGEAAAVSDEAEIRRVAEEYAAKYGWQPEARDGALWADGAPTAGPPPYQVRRVVPTTVFGFPTTDASVPTRWRF